MPESTTPPRAGKFRPAFSAEVLASTFRTMGLSDEEINRRLEQIQAQRAESQANDQQP